MGNRVIKTLTVILFSLTTLNVFGQSGLAGNLSADLYQPAVIYLNSGEQTKCKILIYKKDTLHHSNKIKYFLDGKKEKMKLSKIDSIQLGSITYEKFSYKGSGGTYFKLGTRVPNCENSLLISHWVNDSGYTFVTDKADYMTFDYYVKSNDAIIKINKPGSLISDEHKTVIRQLKRIYPNCSAIEIDKRIRKITYEDIPELITLENTSCGSMN
nr:hypothetical protein [uncultured Allomuricauda sp.]